jgi:predicted metalloprotease
MRWSPSRQSSNVEDRRGLSRGGMIAGGGIGSIIILLVVYLLGGDPSALLEQAPPNNRAYNERTGSPEEDTLKQFVSFVLADLEEVWHEQFRKNGQQYVEPRLVLFTDQVQSACGMAGAAVGPFYCPADSKVYIDLSFYRELHTRFGAPGDFAQAYVIAHEVGHHVQNLLGISDRVHQMQSRMSREEANRLSVRLELQADFLAGVWAHYAEKQNILEAGDLDEALQAASAIGDDKLQKQAQGYVVPESFTHGTSAQRMEWFRRGFQTGDMNRGDTFGRDAL